MGGDGAGAGRDGSARRRVADGDNDGVGGPIKKRPRRSGSGGIPGSSSDAFTKVRSQVPAAQQHRGGGSCGSDSLLASNDDEGGKVELHCHESANPPMSLETPPKNLRVIVINSSDESGAEDGDQGRPAGGSSSREPKSSISELKHGNKQSKSKQNMAPEDGEHASNLIDESPKMEKSSKSSFATEQDPPHLDNTRLPKRLGKRELKPRLKVGDQVFAAWWPDAESKRTNSTSSWYPGRIKAVREVDRPGGEYGPTRYYDIEYDDGDELDDVGDMFVLSKRDYILEERGGWCGLRGPGWVGVDNVVDEKSSDGWARIIGWYTAEIDGEVVPFSRLSEALRAYDSSVVRRKGSMTKPSDLNLPEEWTCSSIDNGKTLQDVGDSDHCAPGASLSSLKGAYLEKNGKVYKAQLYHKGKSIHMGTYLLKCDAAFAYDKALKLLKLLNNRRTPNFATDQQYTSLRATELRDTHLSVDFDEIQVHISSYLSSLAANVDVNKNDLDGDSGNDKNTKKEGCMNYNPSNEFSPDVESGAQGSGFMTNSLDANLPGEHAPPDDGHSDHSVLGKLFYDLRGCNFDKTNKMYRARISHRGKQFPMGSFYKLKSDAAFAYDKALCVLKKAGVKINGQRQTPNFETIQQYIDLRAWELRKTRLKVDIKDIQAHISSLLVSLVKRVRAHDDDLDGVSETDKETKEKKQRNNSPLEEVDSDAELEAQGADLNLPRHKGEHAPLDGKGSDHCALGALFSDLRGCCIAGGPAARGRAKKSYKTNICHKGKQFHMGQYQLKIDAAYAYDKALRLLRDPSVKINGRTPKYNFATDQQYIDLRNVELRITRLSVDFEETAAQISSDLISLAAKVRAYTEDLDGDNGNKEDTKKKKNVNPAATEKDNTETALPKAQHKKNSSACACNSGSTAIDSASYKSETDPALSRHIATRLLSGQEAETNFKSKVEHVPLNFSASASYTGRPRQSKIDDALSSNVPARNGLSDVRAAKKPLEGAPASEIDKAHAVRTGFAPSLKAAKASEESLSKESSAQQPLKIVTSEKSQVVVSTSTFQRKQRIDLIEFTDDHSSTQKSNVQLPLKIATSDKSQTVHSPSMSTTNTQKKSYLIEFTDEQLNQMTLPFTKGSTVWFNFDSNTREGNRDNQGQSFCTGVVTAVCLDHSAHEVLYRVKVDRVDKTEMLPQQKLCYAPSTAVNITMSSGISFPGEVLFCSEVGAKSCHNAIIQSVVQLRESLIIAKGQSNTHDRDKDLLAILSDLCQIDMNRHILAETSIGKYVNKLSKFHSSSTVTDKSCKLLKQWREKAKIEKKLPDSHNDKPCVFSYTILILKGGNRIQVEENVLPHRVTLRKSTHMSALQHGSSTSKITTTTNAKASQSVLLQV